VFFFPLPLNYPRFLSDFGRLRLDFIPIRALLINPVKVKGGFIKEGDSMATYNLGGYLTLES
jgi:hypothetical protein